MESNWIPCILFLENNEFYAIILNMKTLIASISLAKINMFPEMIGESIMSEQDAKTLVEQSDADPILGKLHFEEGEFRIYSENPELIKRAELVQDLFDSFARFSSAMNDVKAASTSISE